MPLDLTAYTSPLGARLAAHLLRRTTFGPSKAQILSFATKTPATALADLLTFTPITSKPIDPANANAATNTTWVDDPAVPYTLGTDDVGLRSYVLTWMLDNFRNDNTLRSKMMLFLHQNWIVDDESWNTIDLYDHVKLLEFYSLGSYKNLAKKMSRDLRMLVYLNGFQNNGIYSPNENYAREFLELFTIGKGPQIAAGNYTNYTENDIKEAAKVLSGYTYWLTNLNKDTDTQIRNCYADPSRHSPTNKTFSSAFQNTVITGTNNQVGMAAELDQFVNMVFNQVETAKNICRKLYRFYVGRNITAAIESDIITPLAVTLKNNNYDIKFALSQLLQSKHFYDLDDASAIDNKIGGMVKSPLDVIMGTLRFFNITPQSLPGATLGTIWTEFYQNSLKNTYCENSAMNIFNATTVAGYPAYYLAPKYDRNWFDSSTITQRYYLGKSLLENKRWPYSSWAIFGAQIDFVVWVKNNISVPSDSAVVVDELLNFLLPEVPLPARRLFFINDILLSTISQAQWLIAWNAYIANGTLTTVKPQLDKLFKAILFSQEYQLQ
jgi:uncharacterized protein (DUF1800 family)